MIQNRLTPYSTRRSGGREARRNLRAAPLAEDLRPIRAGLEGGNFKPLDAAAVQAVDATVYQLNAPAISRFMVKTRNMICCYQDRVFIMAQRVQRFMLLMWPRMNIVNPILPIFMMRRGLSNRWIIFISFSVRW